jgi:hypothetical protein
MTRRSTTQPSGRTGIYNFLLNEVLASQIGDGYELWIVSPWVTDFTLASPFHVSFQELVSSRHEVLHLFDVLHQIAANGGVVKMIVRPDERYLPPLRQLRDRTDRIQIRVLPGLHSKAYVGRFGAVDGSLNLTGGGVNQNAELYSYAHDERSIASLRLTCAKYFDQAEPLV